MTQHFIAISTITIDSTPERVWAGLTDPAAIREYMFGAEVVTDWKEGSAILWRGRWQGKTFEDKGTILRVDPGRALAYNHYSPLSGAPDVPESYHKVEVTLSEVDGKTHVRLTQDNNPSEEARAHSESNWNNMLAGLKRVVEASSSFGGNG